MRVFDFSHAILRRPGRSVVFGLRAGDHEGPSFEGLEKEHRAYSAALAAAGVALRELPALDDFPDSVFVEDPALVFSQGAILLRPGAPSRRDEAEQLAPALRLFFDTVLALPEGYADGGDILVTPDKVYIGLSARTDPAGARSLSRLLEDWGFASEIVQPPGGVLHLKSAASLVDEETLLVSRPVAQSGLFRGFRLLVAAEGEEAGANVLRVNAHLLAGAGHPRTLDLLARHGAEIVPLATTEIAKIDAGLTCMSLRWHAA